MDEEAPIKLVGDEVSLYVNRRIATRLVRDGFAELVLVPSPFVRLLVPWSNWMLNLENRITPRRRGRSKRERQLYGNIMVQHPSGFEMFRTDVSRALWYLSRNLVDIVGPKTLRLKFEPNGPGHHNDEDNYYLLEKENRCVVCGSNTGLTCHHVVPFTFRRWMSPTITTRNNHDMLPVCVSCHDIYEVHADELKIQIGKEMGIDFRSTIHFPSKKASGAANSLRKHADKIPADKRSALTKIIQDYLEKEEVTPEDLETVSRLEYWTQLKDFTPPGQLIMSKVEDIQAFVERWRAHFVATMQPRYLPTNWTIHRSFATKSK